jgi:hypothetical protein
MKKNRAVFTFELILLCVFMTHASHIHARDVQSDLPFPQRTNPFVCIQNSGRSSSEFCTPIPTGIVLPAPSPTAVIPTNTITPTPTLVHISLNVTMPDFSRFKRPTTTPDPNAAEISPIISPAPETGYGIVSITSTLKSCQTENTKPFQVIFDVCNQNQTTDPSYISNFLKKPGCTKLNTDRYGVGQIKLNPGLYEIMSPDIECSGDLNCSQPNFLRSFESSLESYHFNPDHYWTFKPKTFSLNQGSSIVIDAVANDLQCIFSFADHVGPVSTLPVGNIEVVDVQPYEVHTTTLR